MSPTTPEERDPLADRLRDAFPAEVAPATRNRDLAAIDQALAGPAMRLRRGAVIALAGLVVAAPAGAMASESALPGEALYPVKRVSEVVRSVFDEDVADRHRVEEAEVLADRAADLDEPAATGQDVTRDVEVAVDAAFDAVVATEDRADADELRQRALAAADRVSDRAKDLVVALPAVDAERIARLQAERLERLQRELQRQQAQRDRDQREQDAAAPNGSDRPNRSDRPATQTPTPSRSTDARPTDSRPSGSPTTDTRPTQSDRPTTSPTPTRTSDEASPRPTTSTQPQPQPSASPTKDDEATPRKERHEVGRAGVVHLVVRDEGVRLSEVVVADEWTAKADRSREPDGFTVEFRHRKDGRGLLFSARHRDDGTVATSVRELPPPDDAPSSSPAPSDETQPGPSESPSTEPSPKPRETTSERPSDSTRLG